MTDDVKLRRYYLPSENAEGWAEIVIGSNGYFSTVSDYGNYVFRWTAFGDRDFRSFLAGLDGGYVRSKLDPSLVFDEVRTQGNAKHAICLARRLQGKDTTTAEAVHRMYHGYEITAEEARQAYDEVDSISNEIELNDWFNDWAKYLDDYTAIACYMPQPQVTAFVERTLPRLQKLLREELFKEGVLV